MNRYIDHNGHSKTAESVLTAVSSLQDKNELSSSEELQLARLSEMHPDNDEETLINFIISRRIDQELSDWTFNQIKSSKGYWRNTGKNSHTSRK